MSIYGDIIIDHYQNPRNNKRLENPTSFIDVNNPLCGDQLHIEIIEKSGKVKEVGFTGEGCAISIASASMLTEYVKGKSKKEILSINKKDVLGLLHIELTPNRLKCALLAWEGINKVITTS